LGRKGVHFDKKLINIVKESTDELGYTNQYIYSGAGQDSQFVADMIPTTMIFVPSKDGHSHCEIEFTSLEHCWKGANVLLNAVLKIDAACERLCETFSLN
jgi:N-carbamoyl-L-amino-acid hydrolase